MKLLMSILYIAVLGILAHYIGESLPRKLFNETKFPYKPFRFEKAGKVYERIGIRKWKTKVPDMSRIMKDMIPKRIIWGHTGENVQTLIKETCVAEFVHIALCVFGVGIYFIWKNYIGIILAAVFIICNLPFIIIQRYNRPHLITIRDRIYSREEKRKGALINSVM